MSQPGNILPPVVGVSSRAAHLTWTDATGALNALYFDVVQDEQWDGSSMVTEYPVESGPNVADNVRPETQRCTLRIFGTNEPIRSNNWDASFDTPLEIDIPTPSWLPASGIVRYSVWQNNIELRTLASAGAGLVGGAVGGPVASALGSIGTGLLLGELVPGVAVPQVVVTDGGLVPPAAMPPATVTSSQFLLTDDYVRRLVDLLDTLWLGAQIFTVVGSKKTLPNMVIERLSQRRSEDTGTGAEFSITLREIRMVSTTTVPAPQLPQAAAPVSHGAQNTTNANPADTESVLHAMVN